MVRGIIHLDLDAFYASVEQLLNPELRGKPVIVGGDAQHPGRSVVSAASYEARKFSVHSAMPLARAMRLCPQAVVVPVNFPAYRRFSAQIFSIARQYTPLVEPLSLDEAFLDVTDSERRFGKPSQIAAEIRDRIWKECELHASFGVATCKVVAKIASDLKKPQGFVVVQPGNEAEFLAPLPLRRLPGLGPATEKALDGFGIATLGELAALPLQVLQSRVGRQHGQSLWERAQGIDTSSVIPPGRPKSISREETFSQDQSSKEYLAQQLHVLSADVGRRLRAGKWNAETVNLKLRYADFSTLTRQVTLKLPSLTDQAIHDAAISLFDQCWNGSPIRLIGVGVSGITDGSQLDLFDGVNAKQHKLDETLDALRERFGDAAIRRGAAAQSLRDLDFRGEDLRGDYDSSDSSSPS